MQGARQWLGELLLRSPGPIRSLRHIPVLGQLIHGLSHRFVPSDERVWARIEMGPAMGLWIELNPRTGQNYLRGDAETKTQGVLEERLRPGMVFYDLGANIGLFSILAARLVGPAGKVFSFEPDPPTAARLRRNIVRNEFQNTTVIQAGVWSTSGKRMFRTADATSPDRGLGKFVTGDAAANGTLLECIALDDFIQDAPAPEAIKCDVEGAEVEVLRGAEEILRVRRPWILCELHSEENGQAVRDLLGEFGYRLESVDANHVLALPNREI
jgi:FkbM family methyltransferase